MPTTVLSLGALLVTVACGTADENGITTVIEDTTAPEVASTTPSDGATGIPVNSSLNATFSEPMSAATINAGTFTLSGGATGAVSYTALSATLVPDTDLGYSTAYVATLSSTVADLAGNPLGTNRTWSFTTEATPVPPFSFPFASGKRWLYSVGWSRTVVGSTIGVSTTTFAGQAVVNVERDLQWQGRSAWRVLRYDLEDDPSENAFTKEVIYLSDGPDGLDKWVSTGSGGE